jgi:hypothetical protein
VCGERRVLVNARWTFELYKGTDCLNELNSCRRLNKDLRHVVSYSYLCTKLLQAACHVQNSF